jgi:hypothetical protein
MAKINVPTPPAKTVEMIFYAVAPSETNIGLKFVLWEISQDKQDPVYDWGFANWTGTAFEAIEVPEGYSARVMRWANTIDPVLVLNDSRIITLPGQ